MRATDIGYVHENPRLIAAAAWGRALVAARRNDLSATLRWIASAENTALSDDDDMHGVPFLCDVTNMLGAFGELELAQRYFARAVARRDIYPDQVNSTGFLLDARRGVLGDLDGVLRRPPAECGWSNCSGLRIGQAIASTTPGASSPSRNTSSSRWVSVMPRRWARAGSPASCK